MSQLSLNGATKSAVLPPMNERVGTANQTQITFTGLNKGEMAAPGELVEMYNMSSAYYPCLGPRLGREVLQTITNGIDIASFGDKLFSIHDNGFYYNGVRKGKVQDGMKQIAVMNNYVIIFPDKVEYDILNDTFSPMGAKWEASSSGAIQFTDKEMIFTSGSVPSRFEVGDGIVISGCSTTPYNNRAVIIRTIESDRFTFDSNTFEACESEPGLVTIERKIPDLDFICEHNNRLWGCDSNNTIYCSKQGSHKNFNCYDGLVTDSYYAEVGSAGEFTGVASYNGKVYFFKEDCVHSVYGYKPTNFQIIDISTQGVKKGCDRSLAVTNNLLFYVSRDGVMVFDSTVPEVISKKLGYIRWDEAVAGGNRKFYYVCLKKNNVWRMMVYDSDLNLWHEQDSTHAIRFNYFNGDLIYLDTAGRIIKIDSEKSNEVVSWEAVTGDMSLTDTERKATMLLKLRADIMEGGSITVSLSRDRGAYRQLKTFTYPQKEILYIPIQPMRCESFRLKFSGVGVVKLYSVVREYTERTQITATATGAGGGAN